MRIVLPLALCTLAVGCGQAETAQEDLINQAVAKEGLKERFAASDLILPPEFKCVATHVTNSTVQTSYAVSIFHEIPSDGAVAAAAHDIMTTYLDECGGTLADFHAMVDKDTDGMNKGFVLEMVRANR